MSTINPLANTVGERGMREGGCSYDVAVAQRREKNHQLVFDLIVAHRLNPSECFFLTVSIAYAVLIEALF